MSGERRQRWEPVTADELEALTDEELEERLGISERLDLGKLEASLFGELRVFRTRAAHERERATSNGGAARVVQLDLEDARKKEGAR